MTLKFKAGIGVLIASAALFQAAPVFSQDAESAQGEESADVMNELSLGDILSMKITTGSFLELDLKKSPLSMTVITNEMIKGSGARHMSELLEIYVPGFIYNINRWNGTLWAMRGVANDRNTKVIYCVNGHKMNTQSRDGFQSETVLGMLSDIERVEVLRGPAGLVYGCGAIAGIINVVTKKADENNTSNISLSAGTDGSKTVEANMYGTPADDQKLSVNVGFKQSDGLKYDQSRIYGKASWPPTPGWAIGVPSDGRYGATPGNFRVSGDWTLKNFNLYFRATRQRENAAAYYIRDVWPEPKLVDEQRYVDEKLVSPTDPFWGTAKNYGTGRRQYHSDNLMAEGSYDLPINENNLKLKLSYDRNTTRILEATGAKWQYDIAKLEGTRINETFGEARYMLNATYLLKSISNLQAAFGIEDRIDDVGPDMNGDNEQDGKNKHYIVRDITYNTFTVFGEGFYDIIDQLGVHAGFRLDVHTRATMFNPKVALIARPLENHTFKFIYQSASNNGSVDNYEYSRYHIDDNGKSITEPGVSDVRQKPGPNRGIIQPVPSEDVLHELKPEKVHSLEGIYAGSFGDILTVELSGAIGKVKDLFGWSQELFRVVNVGEYNYFNFDGDIKATAGKFKFGANHTFQKPFNTDVSEQEREWKVWGNDSTGHNGQYGYVLGIDAATGDTLWGSYFAQNKTLNLNVVKNSVTYDGNFFLSLPANMTKLYMIFSPFDWLSFNTNLRLIWGFPGLKSVVEDQNDPKANYYGYYHELKDQSIKDYIMKSVSKKWNLGMNVCLPKNFAVDFYVYNILGTDNHSYTDEVDRNTVNTFRKHHNFSPGELDLFSTDQRTIGLTVTKNF